MILVGGDGGELGLGEDEGLEVLRQRDVLRLGVDVDGVKTRLVLVHRVQYNLHHTRHQQEQQLTIYLVLHVLCVEYVCLSLIYSIAMLRNYTKLACLLTYY